jgi:hypothetical protein
MQPGSPVARRFVFLVGVVSSSVILLALFTLGYLGILGSGTGLFGPRGVGTWAILGAWVAGLIWNWYVFTRVVARDTN